jgi:Pyridoxamine 5'-phosphate oxidase
VSGGGRIVTWKELAAAAPELAGAGRALLAQFGVGLAFLATVRMDGAPRLHPVCPVLSDDRLFVLITLGSPKRHDLLRDGRYALQTFPQPRAGSEEFYLAGVAHLVDDAASRDAGLRDARQQADAAEVLFELAIDRAMHTRWENVLTPQMRSFQQTWRAPRGGAAG